MHDPLTVAFDIKRPWRNASGYRPTWVTIWHADPERDHNGRFVWLVPARPAR